MATSSQLTASKDVSPVSVFFFTHCSSALFGFGGRRNIAARLIWSSPTPTEPSAAPSTSFVDAISAPLTWSGVNSGCLARICAAAPEITGAANEVPDSWM